MKPLSKYQRVLGLHRDSVEDAGHVGASKTLPFGCIKSIERQIIIQEIHHSHLSTTVKMLKLKLQHG